MKIGEIEQNGSARGGPEQILSCLSAEVVNVDHVAIAVEDLEKAIEWYTRCLGFRVMERRFTQGERTSMLSAVLVAGGAVVVLVQGTSAESQVSRFVQTFGPGVQHLAFGVRDLDAATARLTAAGGIMDTPIISDVGIRQVFLRRVPGSGMRVELIERRGGDFSDRSVSDLFRTFESKGLF